MLQSDGIRGTPLLDFEAWRALLRKIYGRYTALDIGWNAHRAERTPRDVRLDGVEQDGKVFAG
jgi:AraC family transcriptional regulator, positive regulator of tynA and feaB